MENDAESPAARVDAAAASLGIALGTERRDAVIAWMTRLSAFAADVAAAEAAHAQDASAAP